MAKRIVEFELVDHGIEHEQYFQGCGVSFTQFEDVATGIGDNPAEAIDDALECLAQMDWDVDGMETRILRDEFPGKRKLPTKPRVLQRHGAMKIPRHGPALSAGPVVEPLCLHEQPSWRCAIRPGGRLSSFYPGEHFGDVVWGAPGSR